MPRKRTPPNKQDVFTVRLRAEFKRDENGPRLVKPLRWFSHRSDKGDDTEMSPDEFAAFRDVYLDRIIQPMEANLRVLSLINRDADLYHWWRDFIDGPMGLVPIGSEEFRQSRAGLIHHTYLNGLREMASLSPVDFKAFSLAEVFDVIGRIRMQERHKEYLRKQAIGTNSEPKQTAKGTVDQTVDPAKTDGSERNSNSEKKSWCKLATELKNKWFAAMKQKKQWIPRKQFLTDFLNGKEGKRDKWKGVSVATEDKRFSDNPKEWKADADTLKQSLKAGTKNRR